jgi:hypothetical protein
VERDVQEFGGSLAMFEAFGEDAKSQGLDARDGFVAVTAVAHDTGESRHFSQPTTIGLAFEFDRKGHRGTLASGPAV